MSAERTLNRREFAMGTATTLLFGDSLNSKEQAEAKTSLIPFESEVYPYTLTYPSDWQQNTFWLEDRDNDDRYDVDAFFTPTEDDEMPEAILNLFARQREKVPDLPNYFEKRIEELRHLHKADDYRIAPHYEGRDLFNFIQTTPKNGETLGGYDVITLVGKVPFTVVDGEDQQLTMKMFETESHTWAIDFYIPLERNIRLQREEEFTDILTSFQFTT